MFSNNRKGSSVTASRTGCTLPCFGSRGMNDNYEPEVIYARTNSHWLHRHHSQQVAARRASVANPLKIELSVVESPKVFGLDPLNQLESTAIESDERMIERHVSDLARGPGPDLKRPSRPSSAPISVRLQKPEPTVHKEKLQLTKSADLASPIKISTGNMMLGLNPLLTLPPISPNLRSPNHASMWKQSESAFSKDIARLTIPAFQRKRSGSFTTDSLAHQPPKKRFAHENGHDRGSNAERKTPQSASPTKWSKPATSHYGPSSPRSMSAETVAAYEQQKLKADLPPRIPSVHLGSSPDQHHSAIPKSYAPEFDLDKTVSVSNGTIVTPTPLMPRMCVRPAYDPYLHVRGTHFAVPYSTAVAAHYGSPARPPAPRPSARGLYSMARPYGHASMTGHRPPPPPASPQQGIIQEIRNLPQGECFQLAMSTWQWYRIDGVELPCVLRSGEKYVAVHMVQMKLLAKFPPNVPQELMRKHRMVSYKMSVLESWVLNTVNAFHCKYDFGYQLFSPADDLVRGMDVRKFYFSVKLYNYDRIIDVYRHEINATADLHVSLTAHISSLKACAEEELATLNMTEPMENGTPPYVTPRQSVDVSESPYRLPLKSAPRPVVTTHHYMNGHSDPRNSAKLMAANPFQCGSALERTAHSTLYPGMAQLQARPMMRSGYPLPLQSPMIVNTSRHDPAPGMHHLLTASGLPSYPAHRIHASGHPLL